MWLLVVSFPSLPPILHRHSGFFQLAGIIPGPREPKSIQSGTGQRNNFLAKVPICMTHIKTIVSSSRQLFFCTFWITLDKIKYSIAIVRITLIYKVILYVQVHYAGCSHCTSISEYSNPFTLSSSEKQIANSRLLGIQVTPWF